MTKATPAADRFWLKVTKTDACWLWTGALSPQGYGRFRGSAGKTVLPHRFCYELLKGPIPDGLDLDHLCRVPRCVNPAHLEPVTRSENVRRAAPFQTQLRGATAGNDLKTHCPHGHPYDEANTRYKRRTNGRGVNRICRECDRNRTYFGRYGRTRASRGLGLLPAGSAAPTDMPGD